MRNISRHRLLGTVHVRHSRCRSRVRAPLRIGVVALESSHMHGRRFAKQSRCLLDNDSTADDRMHRHRPHRASACTAGQRRLCLLAQATLARPSFAMTSPRPPLSHALRPLPPPVLTPHRPPSPRLGFLGRAATATVPCRAEPLGTRPGAAWSCGSARP